IPEELRIVMRVEVDEAGRDDHSAGVERPRGVGRLQPPERSDAPRPDADVGAVALRPRPVDDDAVLDDEVEIGHRALLFPPRRAAARLAASRSIMSTPCACTR